MNELQIMNINGIEGYEKDGVVYLGLETVARGLGFTTIAASGNEVVRWNTVHKYLSDLGVATSCNGSNYREFCPEYIPENIFYRLAMKAKNAVAEAFQAKIADEVIPSIRKHGAYMTPATIEKLISDPDTIIQLATSLKDEREKRRALEAQAQTDRPKVLFADSVAASKSSILVGEMAKLLKQNGVQTGQNRFFEYLRQNGYLIRRQGTDYNMPTQKSMEMVFSTNRRTSGSCTKSTLNRATPAPRHTLTPAMTGNYTARRIPTGRRRAGCSFIVCSNLMGFCL